MRLVDADALKEKLNSFFIVGGRGYGKTECQRYLNKILSEIIDDVPTADVRPVKHGHWIEHPDDIFPLESTIECSVCGEQENVNIHNDSFCPNCGAKMVGGDQK